MSVLLYLKTAVRIVIVAATRLESLISTIVGVAVWVNASMICGCPACPALSKTCCILDAATVKILGSVFLLTIGQRRRFVRLRRNTCEAESSEIAESMH